ncbi:MAG: DUF3110 domain-containing protein [Cyanobacteria bacterium P01_A01_bin.135]
MTIYVLLFNAGTDSEGIHTLKTSDDRNIVLMFEDRDDAERYTLMLEAQDFLVPTVEPFDQSDIEDFCQGAGYECKLVSKGDLELPPEASVDETDWEKEQQQPAEPSNGDGSAVMSDSELDRIRRHLEGLL